MDSNVEFGESIASIAADPKGYMKRLKELQAEVNKLRDETAKMEVAKAESDEREKAARIAEIELKRAREAHEKAKSEADKATSEARTAQRQLSEASADHRKKVADWDKEYGGVVKKLDDREAKVKKAEAAVERKEAALDAREKALVGRVAKINELMEGA